MTPAARFRPSIAIWSLIAMASGLFLGVLGQKTGHPGFLQLSNGVAPLGALWLNALQMAVVPLVVTQLLTALVNEEEHASVGVLGSKAVVLFVALLAGAGVFTVAVFGPTINALQLSPDWASSVVVESIPAAAREAAEAEGLGFSDWLIGLIPRNPLEAATQGNLLQTLIFTVLIGLAMGRLPLDQRAPLAAVFKGLADAMMVLVSWILLGAPVGVFCLLLPLGLENGLGTLASIAVYIVVVCSALLAVTALMYPVTALGGRVSILKFAKAMAPVHIVAVGTQSSLASFPAMLVSAKDNLDLPEESTGFVLPLAVSTFKLTQTAYQGVNLLFLAAVFGVSLTLQDHVSFMVGVIVLSFGIPGVPRGVPFLNLPLHLALGIPIEGVVILEAVKTIPDIFMTVVNVTGDMSVATILSRDSRGKGDYESGSGDSQE